MNVSFTKAMVIACLSACTAGSAHAQPASVDGGVRFRLPAKNERSVSVVGDFNGWSRDDHRMQREGNEWVAIVRLRPGMQSYKFLVDGEQYVLDPGNPVAIENYNRTAQNSACFVTEKGDVMLVAEAPGAAGNKADVYPARPDKQTLFLNIIWHQHQPLYADPATDQLAGPWVRTHATKDYYDMAAILRGYPDVHCTFNLTTSLLHQLREYYLNRLGPYVDVRKGTIDVAGFWKRWKGKTDPWIDLALTPASLYSTEQQAYLYRNSWSALGVSEVMMEHFPEYKGLRDRAQSAVAGGQPLSVDEQRSILFWFYLANFDPDFLRGPVRLPGGLVCDLSTYVEERPAGLFRLRAAVTDEDCRRIIVEMYKVMAAVIPVHRDLRYEPAKHMGQIDIITTPFYHPILPLIYDSDLARTCQPNDAHPTRYSYPEDADAQVVKAVRMFRSIFGADPTGMWPGEGSVAQPVLSILREHGILWTASDVKVLRNSRPQGKPNTTPYRFPAGRQGMAVVFRDTELSDRIGFKYQSMEGEEAAEDFVRSLLEMVPDKGSPDALVTVILDGENAWEWYAKDQDGKAFLHAFYRKLSVLAKGRQVVPVTMSEYIHGNTARGVQPHPIAKLPSMEWLWPGSWINGNYDTWIGEPEENAAWEYLGTARADLARSGIPRPDPRSAAPRANTKAWNAWMAWEEMYAAEGSDWFWWYGGDQTAPAGDTPFDQGFLAHLRNIYSFGTRAGGTFPARTFTPILAQTGAPGSGVAGANAGKGAMAMSSGSVCEVLFMCNASREHVTSSVFIVGDLPVLGEWKPNVVAMRDDGKDGDERAGDGIWTFRAMLPAGTHVSYKYTNSGAPGQWMPGDEFAQRNRNVVIEDQTHPSIIRDTFGQ
jgi:alpha-amylase/alpha-mannosidase (GH57 family)